MSDTAEKKVVQYLQEARASELALIQVLRSQIAVTPHGPYPDALDNHLGETEDHAERVSARLSQVRSGFHPGQIAVGLAEGALAQALALAKTPLDLVRGSGGEEKVLKNAKDACATEALEIATYTALERLAGDVGDDRTAKLAASLRADEERMLARVMRALPGLASAVVQADVHDNGSYDIAETGAADVLRDAQTTVKRTARRADGQARAAAGRAETAAKSTARRADAQARHGATKAKSQAGSAARQARKVPGVVRVEGELKGAIASASDLPIAGYERLTAAEIVERLPELSQVDLGKIDAYERLHDGRSTVLDRVSALRADEPWPGYDELTVDDVRAALRDAGDDRARRAERYERAHKNRVGVLSH